MKDLYKGFFSGICDKNGVQIHDGDKIKGLLCWGMSVEAICRFNPNFAAFGLEWQRGNVTEFYPFCQICNVEYEVINNEID